MPKQRYKIYDSEDVLGFGGFFATVEAAQAYTDKILRSKRWKRQSDMAYVKLNYPVFAMSGARKIDDEHGIIDCGAARLCEFNIIHELTHYLTWVPGTNQETDHGPRFAGALLWMYKWYIGKRTSETLKREFDKREVKYVDYE